MKPVTKILTVCVLALSIVSCTPYVASQRENGDRRCSGRDITAVKPILRLPAQDAVFNHYPRELHLVWDAIPGAIDYVVTLEAQLPETPHHEPEWRFLQRLPSADNQITTYFVGAQPGRWKVFAVDCAGSHSMESDWGRFGFLL